MEKRKEIIGTDFTQGPIVPMLFRFFLPFLLANLLNSLYNTVDSVIIGQFVGKNGILAVSIGGKMLNLFTMVGTALAGGGQILIAQEIGAKKRNELNSTIGTLFTEMLLLSVLFGALTFAFSEKIIIALNTPEEAFGPALDYLRITCAGLPFIFGYNAVSSVLRGMGDSKSPLLYIGIAAVLNLIGDIVFIVIFGLGAAGTAYATVLGQALSLLFSLVRLYRRRERFGFDFRPKSFLMHPEKLKIIARIGLPSALRSVFILGTQLVLMGYVNLYGVTAAAAYAVGDKIVHLANICSMSARHAASSMMGQNIGAGRYDRVREILVSAFAFLMAVALLLSIPCLFCPELCFRLITQEKDVLVYAPEFMRIAALIFFLSGAISPLEAVIVATGNAGLDLIGGILDGVVFRIGFSFLFTSVFGMDVSGFFLADALARLGPIIVGAAYWFSGSWKRFRRLT